MRDPTCWPTVTQHQKGSPVSLYSPHRNQQETHLQGWVKKETGTEIPRNDAFSSQKQRHRGKTKQPICMAKMKPRAHLHCAAEAPNHPCTCWPADPHRMPPPLQPNAVQGCHGGGTVPLPTLGGHHAHVNEATDSAVPIGVHWEGDAEQLCATKGILYKHQKE